MRADLTFSFLVAGLLSCWGGSGRATEIAHVQSAPEPGYRSVLTGPTDGERLATEIHSRLLTVDTHVDVPRNFASDRVDLGSESGVQVDFQKMRRGGLDLIFFSAAVGQRRRDADGYSAAYAEALEKITSIREVGHRYPDEFAIITSPEQVAAAHAAGSVMAAIAIENGFAIGRNLDRLEQFRCLGVSYITLAHLGHNDIADSSSPVAELDDKALEHGGVSDFGREVVAEMNRLGIMIDVSHAARETVLDILEISDQPVIASHSGAYGLVPTARNMDDEQLLALKRNQGVIQIIAYSPYVRRNSAARDEAIKAAGQHAGLTSHLDWVNATNRQFIRYAELLGAVDARFPRATVQEFVDHIDYVVELIGIDHVGIGSDFYAGGGAAVGGLEGWMDASESWKVTRELVRRGYSEEEIAKIWGGNLMRVWGAVRAAARKPPRCTAEIPDAQ